MQAASTPGSAPRVLILLVVLAGALLAMSIVQRDRALEEQYEQAEDRAQLYAATVLRTSLGPRDVGSLDDAAYAALQADVQGFVLIDPAVARVRLWTPGGGLFFSTDAAERRGARAGIRRSRPPRAGSPPAGSPSKRSLHLPRRAAGRPRRSSRRSRPSASGSRPTSSAPWRSNSSPRRWRSARTIRGGSCSRWLPASRSRSRCWRSSRWPGACGS